MATFGYLRVERENYKRRPGMIYRRLRHHRQTT